jgi:hypothetical protein
LNVPACHQTERDQVGVIGIRFAAKIVIGESRAGFALARRQLERGQLRLGAPLVHQRQQALDESAVVADGFGRKALGGSAEAERGARSADEHPAEAVREHAAWRQG